MRTAVGISDIEIEKLDKRIARAAELAVRARIHLDFFIAHIEQDGRGRQREIFGEHYDFFRFGRLAHEWAFLIRITALFKNDRTTVNFHKIIRKLKLVDPEAEIESALKELAEVQKIYEAVELIRNKAIAHQEIEKRQEEVYAVADVTTNKFAKLSDASLSIANTLCRARGLRQESFLPNIRASAESAFRTLDGGVVDEEYDTHLHD